LELNPYPTTRRPSRTTSVTSATSDSVICEKSMYALAIDDAIGRVRSWSAMIFIFDLVATG
jgi:hypothetical protein